MTSRDRDNKVIDLLSKLQADAKPVRRKRATPDVVRAVDRVNEQTLEQLRADLTRAATGMIATLNKTPRPPKATKEPQDDASKRFRLLELD